MRATIVELLELPRRLIHDQVVIEICGHAGFFSPNDPECHVCQSRLECELLFHNEDFALLADKPVEVLLELLESSRIYIDAFVSRAGHDGRTCACDLCSWLKQARHIQARHG